MSPALPRDKIASPPVKLGDRSSDAHKGTFGHVMLVGGSRGMSGSIAMSSIAALKSGSGLVSAAVPDRCLETVASYHPSFVTKSLAEDNEGCFAVEAALSLGKQIQDIDAIGVGPGMTTSPGSLRIVERLIRRTACPRVLDADAINSLTAIGWLDQVTPREDAPRDNVDHPFGSVVLTPHPGEFARLVGVPASERTAQVEAAQKLCLQAGLVVVLKGGPTVVANGNETYTNPTGNPGMATGGSGDVLTGVITSLLGQGFSPWDAARLGVWVHGRAGDLACQQYGAVSMTALEIIESLPAAFCDLS